MANFVNIFRVTNTVPKLETLFNDSNYKTSSANVITLQSLVDSKYLMIGLNKDEKIKVDSVKNQTQNKTYTVTSLEDVVQRNGATYNVVYAFLSDYVAYDELIINLSGASSWQASGADTKQSLTVSPYSNLAAEVYPKSKFFLKDKLNANDSEENWPPEETRQWADDSCSKDDGDETKCTGELDAKHPYIYCSRRIYGYLDSCYNSDGSLKTTAEKSWGSWSIPKLWSHYGQDAVGFSLSLANGNEVVYYMSEKVGSRDAKDYCTVIDSDGCDTGAITMSGGVLTKNTDNGEVVIDRLYVDGKKDTDHPDGKYYFIDCDELGTQKVYTDLTIKLASDWTVSLALGKTTSGNYKLILKACTIKAEFNESNPNYLELINDIARIPIHAYNFEHNVERTAVWTLSAIQDVDANGIRRYSITPLPQTYNRIYSYEVGSDGSSLISIPTVVSNTSSLSFTIKLDSYDSSPIDFNGDIDGDAVSDYGYFIRIVDPSQPSTNLSKYVIWEDSNTHTSSPCTINLDSLSSHASLKDLFIDTANIGNLGNTPISSSKTLEVQLFVNDPDYKTKHNSRTDYRLVDSEEIYLNFFYQRSKLGEKGEQGTPGTNGENGAAFSYNVTNDEINIFVTKASDLVVTIPSDLIPIFRVYKNSELINSNLEMSCSEASSLTYGESTENDKESVFTGFTLKGPISDYSSGKVIYVKWILSSDTAGEIHHFEGNFKIRILQDLNDDKNCIDYYIIVNDKGILTNEINSKDETKKIEVLGCAKPYSGNLILPYKLLGKTKKEATWTDLTELSSSTNSDITYTITTELLAGTIYNAEGYYVRLITKDKDYENCPSVGDYYVADTEFIESDENLPTGLTDADRKLLEEAKNASANKFIILGDPNQNMPCDTDGQPLSSSEIISPITLVGFTSIDTTAGVKITIGSESVILNEDNDYSVTSKNFGDFTAKVEYDFDDSILTLSSISMGQNKTFPNKLTITVGVKPKDSTDDYLTGSIVIKKVTDKNGDGVVTTYLLEANTDIVYYEKSWIPSVVKFKVFKDPHNAVRTDVTSKFKSGGDYVGNFKLILDCTEYLESLTGKTELSFKYNSGFLEVDTLDLFGTTANAGETHSVNLYVNNFSDYDSKGENETDWDWVDGENITSLGEMNKSSANKGDLGKIGLTVRIRNLANISDKNGDIYIMDGETKKSVYCYSLGDITEYVASTTATGSEKTRIEEVIAHDSANLYSGSPKYYDIISEIIVNKTNGVADKSTTRIVYYLCKASQKLSTITDIRNIGTDGTPICKTGWSMTEVNDFMAVSTMIADRVDAEIVAAERFLVRNNKNETAKPYVAGMINGYNQVGSFFTDETDTSAKSLSGIGSEEEKKSGVRIFAGDIYTENGVNLENAPFRVYDDGTVYISKLRIAKIDGGKVNSTDTVQSMLGEGATGLTIAPNLLNGTDPSKCSTYSDKKKWNMEFIGASYSAANNSFILEATTLNARNYQDVLSLLISGISANTDYILSFELYADSSTSVTTYIYNGSSLSGCANTSYMIDGVSKSNCPVDGANSWTATSTWTLHYMKFTTGNFSSNDIPKFLVRLTTANKPVQIRNLKLEIDNILHKPTPWCLSEYDKLGVSGSTGAAGKITRTRDIVSATKNASSSNSISFYSDTDYSTTEASKYYDIITFYGKDTGGNIDTYYFKCTTSGKITSPITTYDQIVKFTNPKFAVADALLDFAFIDTLVSKKLNAEDLTVTGKINAKEFNFIGDDDISRVSFVTLTEDNYLLYKGLNPGDVVMVFYDSTGTNIEYYSKLEPLI